MKNKKSYRCIPVVIDNFFTFWCTIWLKNKNAQSKNELPYESILDSSRTKARLIETDDGKEDVNKLFTLFL